MKGKLTQAIGNIYFIILFMCLAISNVSYGQVVKGSVVDASNKEVIVGVAVVVKGTTVGTTTDFDGNFDLDLGGRPLPVTLEFSYLGYTTQDYIVTAENVSKPIKLSLAGDAIKVDGVEITASRISEKQLEEPLTVESMNLAAIKETPASSFYNGLGSLKGVDVTTASFGFVVVNTRGFNSTRPVRSLQLMDGADNQAPGLNFSLGNFVGSSELDIQKVDLVVGASSALYGPNAFNGVINMQTKSPFLHRGLSVLVKGGERNMFEGAVRYAKSFKNKEGEDLFAFKVNFSYLRADDWEATNYAPTEQSQTDATNWSGYDAVNVYGDERINRGSNDPSNFILRERETPGIGTIHRTGYEEIDLVDYNTKNIKAGAALHFKLNPQVEAIATYNFGTGTTVYQGDNRYSLKGFQFHQTKLEFREEGKWFLRAYHTRENAGDSYDAVFTALLLQDAARTNNSWFQNYETYYRQNIVAKIRDLPGYPDPTDPAYTQLWFGETRDSTIALSNSIMQQYSDSLIQWHNMARNFADSIGAPTQGNNVPYFEPGTERFDSMFNDIVSKTSFVEGGSKFFDKSALTHVQGEYKFTPWWLDITVGGSFRYYQPNSEGTIFSDTAGIVITNWEVGSYIGLEKRLMENRLLLTGTARVDKNQNFNVLVSPAASIVYKVKGDNALRLSFSSAIRNPTLQDQYLYYNIGRALLVGNLGGFDSLATVESLIDYYETINRDTLRYNNVDAVRPEKVKSIELGYRGTIGKRIYVDGSYYYSWYNDFLGYQIGFTTDFDESSGLLQSIKTYRVSANSRDMVTTQGFSVAVTYGFAKFYALTGNYSWNKLDRRGSDDPIIPAFNTPEHKFNIGISGRDIEMKLGNKTLKNWGFNINFKWVQGFQFEGSPQFTGYVPSNHMLDAQINYRMPKWYTTFKLGATNLYNNKQFQTYGGPRIGRLAYVSILFEFDKI